MPVFAAATSKSSRMASSWCPTSRAGRGKTERTDCVFCAVTQVRTLHPGTPSAAKDFRSAWIPAPPPESLPAMVSALLTRAINRLTQTSRRAPPRQSTGAPRPWSHDSREPPAPEASPGGAAEGREDDQRRGDEHPEEDAAGGCRRTGGELDSPDVPDAPRRHVAEHLARVIALPGDAERHVPPQPGERELARGVRDRLRHDVPRGVQGG